MGKEKPKEKILPIEEFKWDIPICCREGWEDCPHVVKKEKPKKKNIGL